MIDTTPRGDCCSKLDEWSFSNFNRDPVSVEEFLRKNDVGNTSVPQRQNRALLFDSMLFHQGDPFRFKKGERVLERERGDRKRL